MNEALEDYMREFCVIGYRLVDGSHIIAIEDHYDPDQKAFYVSGAVQVNTNSEGRIFFSPWLINDSEELVRLLDSNIIASSPPIEDVAIHSFHYLHIFETCGCPQKDRVRRCRPVEYSIQPSRLSWAFFYLRRLALTT